MTKACFCGTFDPLTKGHIDIIERAAGIFEEVIVFVSVNSEKKEQFSKEQRMYWIKQATSHLKNVRCAIQTGLVVETCRKEGARVLVRGLRNSIDFQYEQNMEAMNHQMAPEIETVFLMSDPAYLYCSSSNVRELLRYGQDVSHMVPECVWQDLEKVKR